MRGVFHIGDGWMGWASDTCGNRDIIYFQICMNACMVVEKLYS